MKNKIQNLQDSIENIQLKKPRYEKKRKFNCISTGQDNYKEINNL